MLQLPSLFFLLSQKKIKHQLLELSNVSHKIEKWHHVAFLFDTHVGKTIWRSISFLQHVLLLWSFSIWGGNTSLGDPPKLSCQSRNFLHPAIKAGYALTPLSFEDATKSCLPGFTFGHILLYWVSSFVQLETSIFLGLGFLTVGEVIYEMLWNVSKMFLKRLSIKSIGVETLQST